MDTSEWRENVEQVLAAVGLAWCTPPPSPIKMEVIELAIMPVAAFECFADVLPDPIVSRPVRGCVKRAREAADERKAEEEAKKKARPVRPPTKAPTGVKNKPVQKGRKKTHRKKRAAAKKKSRSVKKTPVAKKTAQQVRATRKRAAECPRIAAEVEQEVGEPVLGLSLQADGTRRSERLKLPSRPRPEQDQSPPRRKRGSRKQQTAKKPAKETARGQVKPTAIVKKRPAAKKAKTSSVSVRLGVVSQKSGSLLSRMSFKADSTLTAGPRKGRAAKNAVHRNLARESVEA